MRSGPAVALVLAMAVAALVGAAAENVTCEVVARFDDGSLRTVACEGADFAHSEQEQVVTSDPEFWLCIIGSAMLVLTAGLMSGLTIGLVALDVTALNVLVNSGTATEQRNARTILPVVRRRHLLLVTLLLANALCMEALPLLLDRIATPVVAILVSVTAVLFFGEIIPQALCSRYGLAIGANLVYLVWGVIGLLFLVAWPISKLLDLILGSHAQSTYYRRSQLTELVNLHAMEADENQEPLTSDEVHVIRGALQLKDKHVQDAMTPLDNVFMLNEETVVDDALVRDLVRRGHSRVPVYRGDRGQFVGILLIKSLLDRPAPTSPAPVRVRDLALRPLIWVDADCPLYEMLRSFRSGQTHMAAVRRVAKGGVQVRGIITLEDVMEQLLQEEIRDETDVDKQQHDVDALEEPTPAERQLLARNTSAQAVIDMARGGQTTAAATAPLAKSAARAAAPTPPKPGSFFDTLRGRGPPNAAAESETFLLGTISDDDDDDLDNRPL